MHRSRLMIARKATRRSQEELRQLPAVRTTGLRIQPKLSMNHATDEPIASSAMDARFGHDFGRMRVHSGSVDVAVRHAETKTQGSDPKDPDVPFAMSAPTVEVDPNAKDPVNPVKVTVNVKGPHGPTTLLGRQKMKEITYDDADYFDLYQSVRKHEETGEEAGFEIRNLAQDIVTNGNVLVASKYTMDIEMGVPEWTTKASQPPEDQQKFDRWVALVKSHEQGHANQDILGVPRRLKQQIQGPSVAETDAQEKEVLSQVQAFHDVLDKIAQPEGLEAPGGMIQVNSTPSHKD